MSLLYPAYNVNSEPKAKILFPLYHCKVPNQSEQMNDNKKLSSQAK